jgi:hypothetical protein
MEAAPIIAVASLISSAVYTKKSIDSQKKQAKAAKAAAQKEYDLNVAQTKLTLEQQQRKNRNLLAQQQSAYKARLGASGMSSRSGSGQTVLDNMQREHDIENKYLIEKSNISLESLRNHINETNTRNLLEIQGLRDKQTANAFDTLSSLTSQAGRTMIK